MEQTRLDAIRARCEAATPGEWIRNLMTSKKARHGGYAWFKVVDGKFHDSVCHYLTGADAEFIANARTDVPDILDEIERLTAELAAITAERDALNSQLSYACAVKAAFDERWRVENAKYNKAVVHLQRARGQRDAAQRRAEAAEKDIKDAISMSPYAICGLFCKNHKPGCGGKNCRPEWRGSDAQHDPDGGMGK